MITFLSDEVLLNCSSEINHSMGSFQNTIQKNKNFYLSLQMIRPLDRS